MKKSSFLAGMLSMLLLLGMAGPAFAAAYQKQATLDYPGITITLNGQAVTPKDAAGNVVEPFAIDGTTYLPVRAVADALGLTVDWDGTTQTVALADPHKDEIPPQIQAQLDAITAQLDSLSGSSAAPQSSSQSAAAAPEIDPIELCVCWVALRQAVRGIESCYTALSEVEFSLATQESFQDIADTFTTYGNEVFDNPLLEYSRTSMTLTLYVQDMFLSGRTLMELGEKCVASPSLETYQDFYTQFDEVLAEYHTAEQYFTDYLYQFIT